MASRRLGSITSCSGISVVWVDTQPPGRGGIGGGLNLTGGQQDGSSGFGGKSNLGGGGRVSGNINFSNIGVLSSVTLNPSVLSPCAID